ncbi:MAG: diacylglycerol/lipid kinase family protein [Oligoflexus sp.]
MNSVEQKCDVYVIANPVAGSCHLESLKECLHESAKAYDKSYELYETKGHDNFQVIIEKALEKGAELFIVAGGDGTVSAVASAIVGTDKKLAIIPAGTANLLAKSLQIPQDIREACQLAFSSNKSVKIDSLGTANRSFFSHISMGAYSRIAERTPPKAKKLVGRLAYIWSGFIVFCQAHLWKFHLNIDNRRFALKASTIMIANVGELGASNLKWGTNIHPDDGVVNVCVIKAKTITDYLSIAKSFLLHQPKPTELAEYYLARKSIKITGPSHLPVRGDGEVIAKGSLEATIHHHALQVVC